MSFETECISLGRENSATRLDISRKLFKNSRNLPGPEKGHSSDVIGGIQPITAVDTVDSPEMQFSDITDTYDCDWPRGQLLEASDESEEGGHFGD